MSIDRRIPFIRHSFFLFLLSRIRGLIKQLRLDRERECKTTACSDRARWLSSARIEMGAKDKSRVQRCNCGPRERVISKDCANVMSPSGSMRTLGANLWDTKEIKLFRTNQDALAA